MCRLATLILSSPRAENLSLCFSETNPDTRMQKSNLNGSFPLCWRRQRSPPRAAPCEKQRRPLYLFFVQARCTAVMLSSRLCSCSSSDHLLSDYQIILCSWTATKGLKFIWNWSCTSTFALQAVTSTLKESNYKDLLPSKVFLFSSRYLVWRRHKVQICNFFHLHWCFKYF